MSDTVPDVAGVIVGWRTWRVAWDEDHGTNPVLRSRLTWQPGEPVEAEHLASPNLGSLSASLDPSGGHDAPDKHCMCGIYAVPQATDLVGQLGAAYGPELTDGRAVAGKVALWGRVIEHRNGWRAQYAKPLALALPPEPSRRLLDVQERYGLPSVDDEGLFAAWEQREADYWNAARRDVESIMARFGEEMRRVAETAQRGAAAGVMMREALRIGSGYRKSYENHTHFPPGWSQHEGGRP